MDPSIASDETRISNFLNDYLIELNKLEGKDTPDISKDELDKHMTYMKHAQLVKNNVLLNISLMNLCLHLPNF